MILCKNIHTPSFSSLCPSFCGPCCVILFYKFTLQCNNSFLPPALLDVQWLNCAICHQVQFKFFSIPNPPLTTQHGTAKDNSFITVTPTFTRGYTPTFNCWFHSASMQLHIILSKQFCTHHQWHSSSSTTTCSTLGLGILYMPHPPPRSV